MIEKKLKIGCVVMAAGSSSRFGRNKLLQEYKGQNLTSRALNAVPADKLEKIAVVTRFPEVREQAEALGFDIVWNECPEEGISLTIRLGLRKLQSMDAAMFMVCDQPMLTRASVAGMADFYLKHPDRIVSMAHKGVRGNPCIFPAKFFQELCELTGDTGGSAVIRKHGDSLLLFEIDDASELKDADNALPSGDFK